MKSNLIGRQFYLAFAKKLEFIRGYLDIKHEEMSDFWGIPYTAYMEYIYTRHNVTSFNFLLLLSRLVKRDTNYDDAINIISYFLDVNTATMSYKQTQMLSKCHNHCLWREMNDYSHIPFIDNYDKIAVKMLTCIRESHFCLTQSKISRLLMVSTSSVWRYENYSAKVGVPYLLRLAHASNNPSHFIYHLIVSSCDEIMDFIQNEYCLTDELKQLIEGIRR